MFRKFSRDLVEFLFVITLIVHYCLLFSFQIEPLQSSFSVAALLGDKLLQKTKAADTNVKRNDDGNARPGLPPTPQPSDSEEDEPLRKKRCVEQCELVKVSIIYY